MRGSRALPARGGTGSEASANNGRIHRTLQAPPQRVRELGERESANAIAPGVGALRAFFRRKRDKPWRAGPWHIQPLWPRGDISALAANGHGKLAYPPLASAADRWRPGAPVGAPVFSPPTPVGGVPRSS